GLEASNRRLGAPCLGPVRDPQRGVAAAGIEHLNCSALLLAFENSVGTAGEDLPKFLSNREICRGQIGGKSRLGPILCRRWDRQPIGQGRRFGALDGNVSELVLLLSSPCDAQ